MFVALFMGDFCGGIGDGCSRIVVATIPVVLDVVVMLVCERLRC